MEKFQDATLEQVGAAMEKSWGAFQVYRKKNLQERAGFLRSIARELEGVQEALIGTAAEETHLEPSRLLTEFTRTLFQLTSYAAACEEGSWLDIRIDTTGEAEAPGDLPRLPKPTPPVGSPRRVGQDLRKMLVPLGPVVVFGASNFPFAYSTAGGDTACALAAGCPVVLKAHPAHARTSEMVAAAIKLAARNLGLPEGVFLHLHGASFEVGMALVQHPLTRAVGFTGSFEGGKALFDLANQRPVPIPVFAEMGSVNPVFLLPEKLRQETETIATLYAASITQSVGQFCTNPGILVGIENETLQVFRDLLGKKLEKVPPAKMLHPGIAKSFRQKREKRLAAADVKLVAQTGLAASAEESLPTLAEVPASTFIQKPSLHQEVFGPFSLLVKCRNAAEMLEVALVMEGQLTASLLATAEEVREAGKLVEALQDCCGRLVMNGVPTGVEVALAMQHGGPFPATTDSRFTAVGADGMKRFARPVCYQNWHPDLLPEALKDENPLGLWRTVNNQLTREPLARRQINGA
ncbi:MAG: aldehyde dehydrogenase (NADP(+)) [Flavisolibacter sp.]